MSWSASKRVEGDTPEDLILAVDSIELQDYGDKSAEVREQFQLAKGMANNLVQSGAVGRGKGKSYQVTLSGHANPKHEPRQGYANDMISINVSQVS